MQDRSSMKNVGVDYEKEFHDYVLPGTFSQPDKWTRVGSSLDRSLGGWSFDLPDYHIEGTDAWIELKTVSKQNKRTGNFSLSSGEYERFVKLIKHGNKIWFIVHVQGDKSCDFKTYDWKDCFFKDMAGWWLAIPKKTSEIPY